MTPPFTLEIGGLLYRITTADDLQITEDDAIYRQFVHPDPSAADAECIEVGLRIEDPRPDPSWKTVFESGESWFALRDGERLVFVFRNPRDLSRCWWQAHLGGDGTEIDLIFAPELVEDRAGHRTLGNPLHYPLDQVLTMMVLAHRRGCIVHAAGCARAGRGIAFIGRSGAGKTTLMSLLGTQGDTRRLSDDRLVLRLRSDGPMMSGTPWAGEGLVAANEVARLDALVFLHHGPSHRLDAVDAAAAAHQLLPTTSVPWFDGNHMTSCLDTIDSLVRAVPAYNLHFSTDPGVADVIDDLFER